MTRLTAALVAFAVAAPAAAEEAPGAEAAKDAKPAQAAEKPGRQRARKPARRAAKGARGRRAKALKANMPPGWVWPPSKAMKAEGARCLARLDELGVKWEKGPATRKITTPILVPEMDLGGVKLTAIWRKPPFVMDCHLAEAFAEWGGPVLRAAGVKELRFAGIHDYRAVRGRGRRGRGTLSRHALGLAIDVYEVVTDDDARHVVKGDYRGGDAVLLDVEQRIDQSGAYRLLLTPGNDPRHHHDPFHFEARTKLEGVANGSSADPGAARDARADLERYRARLDSLTSTESSGQ